MSFGFSGLVRLVMFSAYFMQDLAGLDNQFQTFTEVFESVVSGFEAAK